MENIKSPVEYVLYGNYIKYDKMSSMVEENFKGSSANTVNIFIDVYSVIKDLYICETFTKENQLQMSSSLINLCAHMRYFFRNRYRVESKIFLVYSENVSEYNKKMWYGYNSLHERTLKRNNETGTLININVEILDLLIPYLPDIYFLRTDFESGVLMYDIMCHNESIGNNYPNIILTTDPYLFQMVGIVKDTCIFRAKKYRSEDLSFVVNSENLLSTMFHIRNVSEPDFIGEMNPGLCSLFMTLSRCPERSIKSFFNLPKAFNIIYSGVSEHKILNGYNSNTENIWNSLYKAEFDKYTYDMFDRRFRVIDILSQYLVYLNTNYGKVKLMNLVDPDTVKNINNEYFKKFPLDLNRL